MATPKQSHCFLVQKIQSVSVLLNWPGGLIIPLAGFRCHTVGAEVVG